MVRGMKKRKRNDKKGNDTDEKTISLLPITGWSMLSGILDFSFSFGHVYHHIVELIQQLPCDSNFSDDDMTDLHNEKPLQKGKLFY